MKPHYLIPFLFVIIAACSNPLVKNLSKEQDVVSYYLTNKSLISDTFSRMVWKIPVDFRGFDPEQNLYYFFCKKEISRGQLLNTLTIDSSEVEFAPCESGFCEFGGLRGDITGYHVLRTSPKNLKIDPNMKLHCKLNSRSISISWDELNKLKDTLTMYNYKKYTLVPSQLGGIPMANIGAYISKKGQDEFTSKLAKELTKNCTSNEEKAQKLLDFVSNEITYSFADYWYQSEVTKRAHEVIISGFGDCSGKTTLYASMLEQCGIPYCLLYFKNHINVGVAGDFGVDNPFTYTIDNTTYHMAETTIPDFKIGNRTYALNDIITRVYFYHIPGKTDGSIDASTQKPLKLLDDDSYEE